MHPLPNQRSHCGTAQPCPGTGTHALSRDAVVHARAPKASFLYSIQCIQVWFTSVAGSPENLAAQLVQQAPRCISLGPAAHRVRGPSKPRQIPPDTKRELCSEGKPPVYSIHAGIPAQPARCFASHMLQSITADPSLPWDLMPSWSAYGPLPGVPTSGTSPLAALAAHACEPAPRPIQSASENRYFSKTRPDTGVSEKDVGDDASRTAARVGAKAARMTHYESLQSERPHDPEPWLLHALEHIDFNAADLGKDDQSSKVLKVLARGLEKNQDSIPLWLLYLHSYSKRPGPGVASKIGRMAARALEFQPCCYRLWKLAGKLAPDANELAVLLMRGIIAWAPRGEPPSNDPPGARSDAQCTGSHMAVDLALQLWVFWAGTGDGDKIREWVTCLVRDANAPSPAASPLAQLGAPLWRADAGVLPSAARQALLEAATAAGVVSQVMRMRRSRHVHMDDVTHALASVAEPVKNCSHVS